MAKPLVISHRGANRYAPQNTMPAFERAYSIGINGFETDVHLTKDGQVVICHNYSIDETSDGVGEISNKTLENLKSYDFGKYFSEKYRGTQLPTLDEFLSFIETTDISVLNIEIKSPKFNTENKNKKSNDLSIVSETIRIVKEHGLFDRLLISSFDPALLVEAKKIDPACQTGFLYSPNSPMLPKMGWRPIKFAKEIGVDAIHPHFMFLSKKYVEKAHANGIKVNTWTVNTEKVIDWVISLGVDAIITDFPDVVSGKVSKF